MANYLSVDSVINHMNVYIRRAIYDVVPLGWKIFERIIFDYEILYIAEGHCYMKLGENEYHAQKGDLFFIKPNTHHHIYAEGTTRLHQPHIHFDIHYDENSRNVYIPVAKNQNYDSDMYLLRQDVTTKELLYIQDYFQFGEDSLVKNLMMRIIELHKSITPSDIILKNSYLLELLSYLIQRSSANYAPVDYSEALFRRVNEVIESSYNKEFSMSLLGNQIGYSKNYFTLLYKEKFGQTPKQYHEKIKLGRAMYYLEDENISITEISYALGFETIHDFSRFFKRKTGISPSQWRKQHHRTPE